MELAKPPDDPEQKNIIDKLANFVARNGPEFEHLTKQKQKDNPRFSFLFGGENYNYYQYRVTTEQAILKKQQQQQQVATSQHGMLGHTMPSNTPWQQNPPPTNIPPPGMALPSVPPPQLAVPQPAPASLPVTTSGPPTTPAPNTQDTQQKLQQHVQQQVQLEAQIKQKQEALQQLKEQLVVQQAQAADQITQSNSNLAAQYQSLRQQQEILIQQAISDMKETQLDKMAQDCGVSVDEIDNIVKPIIEACTKDAISTGKNWIFSHNQSEKHGQMITRYLLHRVTAKEATFELRLHLIYLINDVLHHCKRKNLDETLAQFGRVVVPIFCTTHVAADDDQRAKLTKLLNLWKQNGYFNDAVEKMADPGLALSNYQAMEREEFNELAKNISRDIQTRYGGLQKQHNDFVTHVQAQLTQLQTAVSSAEAELKPLEAQLPSLKATITNLSAQLLPAPPQQPPVSTPTSQPTASSPMQQGAPPSVPPFPPPHFQGPPPNFNAPPPGFPPGVPPGLPPPGMSGPGGPITMPGPNGAIPLPDLSRPPPGFMGLPPTGPPPLPQITEADLMPSVPYYELPAGLLAPLVKLEDSDYKPLRPKDIRLPPPMPPSERLLAAVEAFYSPPSHDRPRDAEGWEKLGLYEFFKAKQKAKKLREIEDRNRKDREREEDKKEREREKEMDDEGKKNETKRRRYQEVQQPRPRRSRSRSRSRSGSPLPYLRSSRSRSRSKSRSKSRSPRRSVTPPPRRRSKSRSPTPPSFFNEPFYQTNTDSRLGEENKGHQLMRKMGWGGGGLGSSEQGRVDPIEAAEVRDRTDMYKGIGTSMTDPFEQFRKSKSQGYTNRMRAITEKAASTKN